MTLAPYDVNKKLVVINLVGGPSCGKSTTAAGLFYLMKKAGFKCDLVYETAKDMVWDRCPADNFKLELEIFAEQNRRIHRLAYHDIEYVIVDSPLFLAIPYSRAYSPFFGASASFTDLVMDVYNSYTNVVIYLDRSVLRYEAVGRNETLQQAISIDQLVKQFMDERQIQYRIMQTDDTVAEEIVKFIKELGLKVD